MKKNKKAAAGASASGPKPNGSILQPELTIRDQNPKENQLSGADEFKINQTAEAIVNALGGFDRETQIRILEAAYIFADIPYTRIDSIDIPKQNARTLESLKNFTAAARTHGLLPEVL